MNQPPPINSRGWPLLQRERWRGGKIKPAKDVWDRDEVESNLRYKENGHLCSQLHIPGK